jgi:predicted acetyltransferase
MVHPDHNSKGYDKEMMFYILDYVITKNKKKILISTNQHANPFWKIWS